MTSIFPGVSFPFFGMAYICSDIGVLLPTGIPD
jgi:hypothetical protein